MNDIRQDLLELQNLQGADFVRHLKLIVSRREFHPLNSDPDIFIVGGESDTDFPRLIDAARKAVGHGYRVFLLPNPLGIRTADYIFVRKGAYKMYDLKTISGTSSVGNRLQESIGQSNRVLLNITTEYNPVALARHIRRYFEKNPHAVEVLVYKGKKSISIHRDETTNGASFFKYFVAKYIQ